MSVVDARTLMREAGADGVAIEVFERQLADLRRGRSALVRDADIEPYRSPPLPDSDSDRDAIDRVVMVRLNGGLGTSMGMERAKSLLPVRRGLSFLDVIVGQVLHARQVTGARLPVTFLHSFSTSADCLAVLRRTRGLVVPPVPLELLQNRVPRLRADGLAPIEWPSDPALEWCPPGHGDLYPVLFSTGFLQTVAAAGYRSVFVANADNLGARPDPTIAAWFEASGSPFAVEAVRRTPSDRKGGHFARRRSDGRLILRETAQTPPEEVDTLDRHPFASTNNLWIDVERMQSLLECRRGDLHLPVIANRKHVVPTDSDTPEVIQLETAMGAAIEIFGDATTVEVGRDRFIPVKTTDDLLVVRSDCYRLTADHRLEAEGAALPFVSLGEAYRSLGAFDRRFPAGPPSLVEATSLIVHGDWTFGRDVRIVGDVVLGPGGGRVEDGAILDGPRP